MLQQIDDGNNITKDDKWQQSTYKLIFEEVHDMLRQPRTMEDLDEKTKKLMFEGYNKKKFVEKIYRLQDVEEKKNKSKFS